MKTFERWQGQYNTEHKSLSWLRCERDPRDKTLVSVLWCEVCQKYEARIRGQKSFSKAWIEGMANQRTSNVLDHANSGQHKAAMSHYKADQAKTHNESAAVYAPIASLLMNMDAATKARMKRKFDICYVMAEGMSFSNKPVLVGGGTDGASANVSQHNGMRGKLQRALPWLFWAWCYAHRLELDYSC